MNPHDAALSLFEALLAEAQHWACDDAEDQEVLEAIDRAPTPLDKLALMQNSSLVPSGLSSAVADALLALDPATYSPAPAPTAPGTSMADPELHRIREALITVVTPSPEDDTPSDDYEIQVHGVSVLIRRAQWGAHAHVPYVHIEDQADTPGLLLVEVNDSGKNEHPLPHGTRA
ncbi:hypothetical protein PZB75_30980 (plasmid) [Streptomyces sp. AM 4-1-1]|uniref:hypothetical protein n=1 Tax=Streptomyces sp. AM 4-1-1 TaxID=3028710 RepID=UPI0023B9BDF7|nr:hypothetical protein [Streptomyces sp. AM 4-1-1]WEH37829.1 hypothetical protein PZB75_30980 [Streptomyces sp. AM 4-1-1]